MNIDSIDIHDDDDVCLFEPVFNRITMKKIPKKDREMYYTIQRRHGDILKTARTMIEVGIPKYEDRGWKLRQYDTIINQDQKTLEIKHNPNDVAYLEIENDNSVKNYIVYVKK